MDELRWRTQRCYCPAAFCFRSDMCSDYLNLRGTYVIKIDYRKQIEGRVTGKEVNKDMRNKFVSLSAIALFALTLTVVGCGKKEEPAPPPPPPAPAAPAEPAAPAAEPAKEGAPADEKAAEKPMEKMEKKEEAKTK